MPKSNAFKIEENEKIIYIVERILEFNNKIRSGKGLKILTPKQMLSRLPIFLAQLNAGNKLEKFKMKLESYYIICTVKTLKKDICKSLVDII